MPHGFSNALFKLLLQSQTISVLCHLVPCVHSIKASKHSGNCASYTLSNVFFAHLLFLIHLPLTKALPLPALFNSSLTQTVKRHPEAMSNNFVTLTRKQVCPELPQTVKNSMEVFMILYCKQIIKLQLKFESPPSVIEADKTMTKEMTVYY